MVQRESKRRAAPSPAYQLPPGDGEAGHPPAVERPDDDVRRQHRALTRWLGPGLVLALFFLALHVMRGELRAHSYREIARTVRAIPEARILASIGFTVLSYVILIGYDTLALAFAGRTKDRRVPLYRV